MAIKVWAPENVLDRLTRVPVPYIVLGGFPLWMASRQQEGAFISEVVVFPLNIAKANRVDLSMEVQMAGDGGGVVMRDQRRSPQFKDVVNLLLRELRIGEQEIREFETGSGDEGRPIICWLWCWQLRGSIWRDEHPVPITAPSYQWGVRIGACQNLCTYHSDGGGSSDKAW